VAAAQVISRLRLTWTGRPGNVSETTGAFQVLFYVVVSYFGLHFGGTFISGLYDEDDKEAIILDSFDLILHLVFFIFTVYILFKARVQVREKYGIPAQGNEDFCCSCFCPCFVAAQMLRHTTDYDTYPSTCCTETGIPPHAPSIV
jgi:Cys-rich protein (TIGR01571 family)